MPHLPGTPRPASSLPPGSVRAASTQPPSSSGNIRPVKREVKVEPEKKDPERKVTSEPAGKGRVPLMKVEEVTVEEGTPVKPPDPGKSGPAGAGLWAGVLHACPAHEWFYLTPFLYLGIGNSYSLLSLISSSLLSLFTSLHPSFSLFTFSSTPHYVL